MSDNGACRPGCPVCEAQGREERFERGDVGKPEATRDPIFLFQWKKILADDDFNEDVWETDSVFFTREEGERFGRNHAYRWPNGWRVYCVPANGVLAELLRKLTHRAP